MFTSLCMFYSLLDSHYNMHCLSFPHLLFHRIPSSLFGLQAIKSPQLDYSHFISLPLAIHPGLVEKLIGFQNSILGNPESGQDVNLNGDSSEGSSNDDNEHVKVMIDDAVGKIDAIKMTRSSILSDTPASIHYYSTIYSMGSYI